MSCKKLLSFFIVTALLAQTMLIIPKVGATGETNEPVRIIMDQDLSSDWDDVGDLAVANALADLGECQIIACMSSSDNGFTALCMNAINNYYGRGNIPCGTRARTYGGGYPGVIASEFPHPLYPTYNDPPLCLDLYKQVLAAQPDNSVVIITTGYLNNLEDLMKDPAGMDLIRRKVKMLSCAGGVYPKKGGEFNFCVVPEASEYVINNWPTQAFFDGYNIGQDVYSGIDLLHSTKMDNPVRRVWEDEYNSHMAVAGWDGAYPTWAQIMIYYAVRNDEARELFDINTSGYNFVYPDGQNEWKTDRDPSGAQEQGYLIEKQRQATQDTINTLVNDSIYPKSQGTQAVPNKPTNVRANVTAGGAVLNWNDNSWNETGFTIERRFGSSGSYTVIGNVGENVTTFTDTGVTTSNARDINYRVTANNSFGGNQSTVLAVYSGWTETNETRPGTPIYIHYQNNLTYPWITPTWPDTPPEMKHTAVNNDAYHGKNLRVSVKVSNDSPQGNIYIYFFYQNANNWYRLNVGSAQESGGCTKFEKCINGTISQIGGAGKGYYMGFGSQMQTWELTVSSDGTLSYWSNNADESPYSHLKRDPHEVLTVTDNLSFDGGGLAIGSNYARPGWGNFLYETGDIQVSGVSIDPTSAIMNIGGTKQLKANVTPLNATNKAVTWSSSNTSVATVDNTTGLVTGVADGNATITATTQDGSKTATCEVTVSSSYVPVSGISIDPTSATVNVGEAKQLTANLAPANAYNKNVTWSSSNTNVATVNSSGLVTGVAAGNATITATTQEGGKTATCSVTVPAVTVTSISIDPASTTVNIQGTRLLTATISPANATNKSVTWSSSNESIATVNSTGVVTGVKEGNVTITATTQDGGKVATCEVTVLPNAVVEGVEVTNYTELKNAINATVSGESADNPTNIIVKNNIALTGSLDMVGNGKFKTLVADGNYTISRGSGCTGFMVQVLGGATLNLGKANYGGGALTFDGALSGSTTDAEFYINEGSTFNMYSGIITNHKGNGSAAIRVNGISNTSKTKVNLYGGTISNNTGGFAFGAIHLRQFSDLLIDGANIIGNTCTGEGSAIMAQNGSGVVFKSGLIKGNGGNSTILIISEDPSNPATFEMHGGTIEGIGDTYSDTANLITIGSPSYPNQPSTAVFYGGTIKNTAFTAIQVAGNGGSATFTSENGGNGLVMQNCGYDGNRVTASDAGCIKIVNNGTVNVNSGTFKDSRASSNGGFASILSGTLNLSGGIILGCDKAIRQNGGTLNISGGAKLSSTDSIVLGGGKTVTITGNLTTDGAVAKFADVTNGQLVLSGDSALIAANAVKFAAVTSSKTCGVGSDGKVNESIAAPEFIENPPETIITLGFTGTAATVNSNVAIPSANLIVSSYDTNSVLVDIKIFPVAVEANVTLTKTLTDFNAGAKVKVMLWNSLDKIIPLTDVFVQ